MTGRWPANVILSPDMAAALNEQSGVAGAHGRSRGNGVSKGYHGGIPREHDADPGQGGASRFFLTAGYEPWELEWIIANGLTPCGT